MSQDSISQWVQVTRFEFEPRNPIFHTLLEWLVTRLWMSPAAVASAQILGLSLSVGYALYRFEAAGIPKLLICATALISALVPPLDFFMVTLWKDVSFAIVYIWFTIVMFELYYSKGLWITKVRNMVMFGSLITLASLLRYNGLIEMIVLVIFLVLMYKKFWKRWVLVGILAFTVMSAANFAFEHYLPQLPNARGRSIRGATERIIEHRIRAHIFSGSEIQQKERDLLSYGLPSLAVFKAYNCHISLPPEFDYSDMLFDSTNTDELISAYLSFAAQSPWVEVRHQICNLSILWRVFPRSDETKELVPVKVRSGSRELVYQVTPRRAELAGVSQDSKIPALAFILGEYITQMAKDKSINVAPWRIAPYAYLIMIGLVFRVVVYEKDFRFLVLGGPVIVHLGIFTFGNLFEDFRYNFMIIPIASILWPLLFMRGRISVNSKK